MLCSLLSLRASCALVRDATRQPGLRMAGSTHNMLAPAADRNQIHRWADRTQSGLVKKHGEQLTVSKLFDDQKVALKSIERFSTYGKIVCKPEHTEQQLKQRLESKEVPEKTIKAWTNKVADVKENFEVFDGHILSADSKCCSGEWRGGIQITTLRDGNHEVWYVFAGTHLKVEQKLKRMLEVKTPITGKVAKDLGTEMVKETVTKKGIFGSYQEEEMVSRKKIVMEDQVLDHKIDYKPEYHPEAMEPELYEKLLDIMQRDVIRDFSLQYPAPSVVVPEIDTRSAPKESRYNLFDFVHAISNMVNAAPTVTIGIAILMGGSAFTIAVKVLPGR